MQKNLPISILKKELYQENRYYKEAIQQSVENIFKTLQKKQKSTLLFVKAITLIALGVGTYYIIGKIGNSDSSSFNEKSKKISVSSKKQFLLELIKQQIALFILSIAKKELLKLLDKLKKK